MSINCLPKDVLFKIALNLDIKSLAMLLRVNKSINKSLDTELFWMNRCLEDFGCKSIILYKSKFWKEFYERASVPDVDQLLFDSCEKGIIELVMVAVARGANLETVRSIKHIDYIPLTIASENGHLEVVKYLVQRGANIHAEDDETLILASIHGHLEVVKYLVQQGADIHALDDEALRCASKYGHLEIVKYLESLM